MVQHEDETRVLKSAWRSLYPIRHDTQEGDLYASHVLDVRDDGFTTCCLSRCRDEPFSASKVQQAASGARAQGTLYASPLATPTLLKDMWDQAERGEQDSTRPPDDYRSRVERR
ncbi:hypothetical protein BSZ36_07235 [Rubricoccus marinus]|uniref:Uncharacterized protein n=1 Tax=Rubricoccus marinus TaxID=716817 RepID=A0A259TYY6_9BACT|nr:hypothetical protein BSZ36_07235 [Rubricoccus marinus]